jgi:hypothetical protein
MLTNKVKEFGEKGQVNVFYFSCHAPNGSCYSCLMTFKYVLYIGRKFLHSQSPFSATTATLPLLKPISLLQQEAAHYI